MEHGVLRELVLESVILVSQRLCLTVSKALMLDKRFFFSPLHVQPIVETWLITFASSSKLRGILCRGLHTGLEDFQRVMVAVSKPFRCLSGI